MLMKKYLKYILICLRSVIIFILIGAILSASVKNVMTSVKVSNFKAKGVYQQDISTDNVKFYRIESNEELPSYIVKDNLIIPGAPGDILVTKEALLGPSFVRAFITFFAGGHAALCTDSYTDLDFTLSDLKSIEATGLEEGANLASSSYRTYWGSNDIYNEVIGLRVRTTEEQRQEVLSVASSLIGDPYNYSFLFDTTNKSYCSDLVSKAYSYIGINLNKDDFTTSIYDLIVSGDTYISYYHYYDSNGTKNIYYLG